MAFITDFERNELGVVFSQDFLKFHKKQQNPKFCVIFRNILNKHKQMGRPATKPARLRNGFYIEVKTQGSGAILVRRDTREQMLLAAEDYARTKDVTIRGEMRDDKWVD